MRLFPFVISVSLLIASYSSNANEMPRPLRVKLTDGKTSHQCVQLFPSGLRTRPVPEPTISGGRLIEMNRLEAVGVLNSCSSTLAIQGLKIAKEAGEPDRAKVQAWNPESAFVRGKGQLHMFSDKGESCELGRTNSFWHSIKSYFIKEKQVEWTPQLCRSMELKSGEQVAIAIPYGSLFRIIGDIEGNPYTAQARIVEPEDTSQLQWESLKADQEAAEKGDIGAIKRVALHYITEYGSYRVAVTMLRQAAEKGDVPAQVWLGEILLNHPRYHEVGLEGFKDCAEAKKWLALAANASPQSVDFVSVDQAKESLKLWDSICKPQAPKGSE